VLGIRAQLSYVQGFGGDVAPPQNRIYSGGEGELRGFDVRGATPYGFVPTRVNFQYTTPDNKCVPQLLGQNPTGLCETIPLPIYGIASIGGDTNLITNVEYRIPIAGPVTFSFFNDFGIDTAFNKGQLQQSIQGFDSLTSGGFGCTGFDTSGACVIAKTGSLVGFQRDIRPISGTNFVPRMSTGAELSVIMPVLNAPIRFFYAYNPLRLYEHVNASSAIPGGGSNSSPVVFTRDMFPNGDAGTYSYNQALQAYDTKYLLREPLKTFRLSVSTTF
jgi:outer membrane protein insertion porin family